MFWRHANNLGGYVKTFGEKKNKLFGWKHFLSINFVGLHLLSSNFWPDKWGLCEGYDGINLGEKGFQLFTLATLADLKSK